MQLTEKDKYIVARIEELFYKGEISNTCLIALLKQAEELLRLRRVSEYAKEHKISTQGARKFRNPISICGYAVIPDNK